MEKEIVIGKQFTSIIGTNDDTYQMERNRAYNENVPVNFKPLYRKRTIKTKDFYGGLKTNLTNCNEILPVGCKYFQTCSNGRKIIVIEEQPRIRTIKVELPMEAIIEKLRKTGKLEEYGYENYLKEEKGKDIHSFQLAFPYVVFVIMLNPNNGMVQMQPFFRLHPITSLADYLFITPLYNIPTSQTMCLGSLKSYPTVLETTENIIETFWLNTYNKDYSDNVQAYEKSPAYEVHDYLTWMYFSKVNPMFIYNVKWIKHNRNLSRIVSSMKANSERTRNSESSFNVLHDVAFGTTSSDLVTSPGVRNITYSIAVNGGSIQIGDELLFNKEKFYLYSINSNDQDNYTNVELENEKGELISVPYNRFRDGLGNLFTKNELKEANVNGQIIKPDDIITYSINNYPIHKRIKSIRLASDGKIEALIDYEHYLIENIEFEVMSLDDVKINGEVLDKEKDYYLCCSNDRYNNSHSLRKMKFKRISISQSGKVMMRFVPINENEGSGITMNQTNYEQGISDYTFIDPTTFITPDILCHFDKLLYNDTREGSKFKIIKEKGIFVGPDRSVRSYCSTNQSTEEILKKILIANETRLFIPCISGDIDFKVGDPIIYANWDQPEDMFIISAIDSFEYNKNTKEIFIHSTSLNKKVKFEIPYVNLTKDFVNIGVVRKVESSCGEWKSGDKIKANTTGVTNFPKKDTNTIIAFINDDSTKYALALCSNLCTLWMDEDTMNKFEVLPFKSTKWQKSEIAPIELDKIKWQHGDHFMTHPYLIKFLGRRQGTKYAFEYHYATSWGSLEWGVNISKNELSEYTRHGILMPRIAGTNPRSAKNGTGYPNMLGGFMIDNKSSIHLRSEQFKEDF